MNQGSGLPSTTETRELLELRFAFFISFSFSGPLRVSG